MAPFWNQLFGSRGERVAARFLKRQGFQILARNVRNRFGEIDLVGLDGDVIVFVEVKTRRSGAAGEPFEAVTRHKQRQLTKAAVVHLKRHRLLDHRTRFDVIGIVWPDGRGEPEITHYRHAFEPVGDIGMV